MGVLLEVGVLLSECGISIRGVVTGSTCKFVHEVYH